MEKSLREMCDKKLYDAKMTVREREIWKREEEMKLKKKQNDPVDYEQLAKSEFLFETQLYPKLTPAKEKDYICWLEGYIGNGGKPTIYYSSNFEALLWYVAIEDLKTPVALYDVMKVNIIVPEEIEVADGNWGEINFYRMRGFEAPVSVPVFNVK